MNHAPASEPGAGSRARSARLSLVGRTGRLLLLRAGLVLGGLGVGLLAAELALRGAGISYPLPYYPDEACGSRLRPGFSGWFSKEGQAQVQVNAAGFRDVEHALEKPAGTYRIAVIGDSYVEAAQVAREETFWARLPGELASCEALEGRPVEVLAFGVSGWGTAQELQALRVHVLPYQPDLVVLAFFAGNDVRNNSRALEPEVTRPFYELRDGELQLDQSFLASDTYRRACMPSVQRKVKWINRLRLLQVLNEMRQQLRYRQQTQRAGIQAGVDQATFGPPADPRWQAAWEVTEALLAEMQRLAAEQGAEFCVLAVTRDIQVHPDPRKRARFAESLGVERLDYAERRLQQLGRRAGFPVIVLLDEMLARAEAKQQYLHGFANTRWGSGHWNAAGHAAAAEILARALCAALPPARLHAEEQAGLE